MAQKKFIIDGGFQVSDDSVIAANLEMSGHIIPSVDSDGTTGFDLGSTTAKWRDLYLSEGSLYINNQKVIEDNSGTIVVRADEDQSLTIKTEGTGVLTLQSAQTVNMSATLQMAAGKKITDATGTAVVFGDKVDMDNNQIINLANPTENGHAATKSYVDDVVGDVINGAPGALDTLNELANALGDDANFASTVTNALATKATTSYVDTQIATALASAGSASTSASDAQTTADAAVASAAANAADIATLQASVASNASDIAANTTAVANAISTASADATTKANAALASAQSYADTAEADAISTAAADATSKANAALASAQSYADQAEADAVAAAEAKDVARATAASNDATTKANAAQAAAEATAASGDATVASNAAADATSKANAALASANSYTDGKVSALVAGAPGALDTLNELAAALGDDANFASTVTSELNSIKTQAVSSFQSFHERGANITDAEETTNATSTVSRTFSSIFHADHFEVYLNRMLLRGPEAGSTEREYTVSGTTITFEVGVLSSSDNIEVRGFVAGTIS